jgi:hypothetical protein
MSSSSLDRLKEKYEEYREYCKTILPKVDHVLVADLLNRLQRNPHPIYMVEVFTKPGVDSERIRNIILEKTGMMPSIYDNGTHYVVNQKLTLEMLKEISDADDVLAVEGDYTEAVTGLGSSHSWDEVRIRESESQESL